MRAQRRRCRRREKGEVKPERYAQSSAMRAGAADEQGGGRRAAMAGDLAEAEVKAKFGCQKADTAPLKNWFLPLLSLPLPLFTTQFTVKSKNS